LHCRFNVAYQQHCSWITPGWQRPMMRLLLISCSMLIAVAKMPHAEETASLLGYRTVAAGDRLKGSVGLQQQLQAIAIAPVEIGLIVTSLVIILCIALLIIKWRKNTQKLDKLHARVRGLHHSILLEEQKQGTSQEKEDALKAMLSKEQELSDLDNQLKETQREVEAGETELKAQRAMIATQKAEIKFLSAEDKALINQINNKGKVHVDLEKKLFKFVEPIHFRAEYITPDMDEAPPAEFDNPAESRAIIGDLAQILNYVKKAVILVEGHTSGGEQAMSKIGFQIASERAEKVVETLVELGVDPKRLEAKGLPGLLGDNSPDVKLKTLSWGM